MQFLFTFTQNALALLTGWFGWSSKSTKWRKKSSFMGLIHFECPLRGEKQLLLEQEHLDSVLTSISTWSSASILNLIMWILKMNVPKTKTFVSLKSFSFQNGKMDRKLIKFPLRKIPPWNQKFFDLPQNPKIQLQLSLAGGAHYAGYDSYSKKLQVAGL